MKSNKFLRTVQLETATINGNVFQNTKKVNWLSTKYFFQKKDEKYLIQMLTNFEEYYQVLGIHENDRKESSSGRSS